MADNSEADAQQAQNIDLRRAINDAYAFVEGQKLVQSFAAVTFEELLDQQIERIEGTSTPQKPNELDRLDKVVNDLTAAVTKIKSMPDNAFSKNKDDNAVNTPE